MFELRLKAYEGIARVVYFTWSGQRIIMLHQFVKKSQKTPRKEIQIASRRMKEMQNDRTLRARALARPEVKAEYERLKLEFDFLDQILLARKAAGLTQGEIARRIGTTQSAVARLESGTGKHLPSLATLHKYADAVGCRVEIKLVKGRDPHLRSNARVAGVRR